MKKGMKILISIFLLIGIGIGSFAYVQHREHEKMVQIATSKEAKKVYEDYLKKEDPNAFTEKGFVHSYQVDEQSLDYNPMGGLMVTLIINDDREMLVDFNLIENTDGTYLSAFYGSTPKFWKTRDRYYNKGN